MRIGTSITGRALLWLLMAPLAPAWVLAGQGTASIQPRGEEAAGFREFSDRVQKYIQLRKAVEGTIPALKPTDLPEMITAHQQALARKIREARPQARRGDIFTHRADEAFRHAIRPAFRGPEGARIRATIQQGEGATAKKVRIGVNETYPDGVPYATVPPSLLLRLPKLPEEVAYRLVGRDLALLDVKANLVVDVLHEAIP